MSKNPRNKEGYRNELAEQAEGSSRSQNQEEATPPDDKQGRLLSLAKKLQKLFPEQYEELAQVIERVEKEKVRPSRQQTIVESGQSTIKSPPISVPGNDNKLKGRIRAASGGSTTSNLRGEQEREIDPTGRAPDQKDPLIHVFVDQCVYSDLYSFIGLKSQPSSNILYGLPQSTYRKRSNTLPTNTTPTPAVTRMDSGRTRPVPISSTGSNARQNKTQPLSLSFPTTSPLSAGLRSTDQPMDLEPPTSANLDRDGGLCVEGADSPTQKIEKPSRRLWYAALILVLERGRPITRTSFSEIP